jgi:cytochrome c-type protein NapC
LTNSFYAGLEATNKLDFCVGCHEMRENVYPEYQKTIHYSNRTGVRVTCPDCHVPKDFTGKMIRKVKAAKEIWSKLNDYVSTPEKFESHRMELATNVWASMKASDSRECRNCHDFDAMSGVIQKQTVYNKHMKAKADGGTCIDCHKGIAHHLPKEYRDPEEE